MESVAAIAAIVAGLVIGERVVVALVETESDAGVATSRITLERVVFAILDIEPMAVAASRVALERVVVALPEVESEVAVVAGRVASERVVVAIIDIEPIVVVAASRVVNKRIAVSCHQKTDARVIPMIAACVLHGQALDHHTAGVYFNAALVPSVQVAIDNWVGVCMGLADGQIVRMDRKGVVGAGMHLDLVTLRGRINRFLNLGIQIISRVVRRGITYVDRQCGQHGSSFKRLEGESGLPPTQSRIMGTGEQGTKPVVS